MIQSSDKDLTLRDYSNFLTFVHEVILPFEPPSHKEHSKFHTTLMYDACHQMIAQAAPRGSLKSTILARYRPLHRLVDPTPGTNPLGKVSIMIVSETSALGQEHLDWIKWNLVNNEELLRRYGKLAAPTTHTWNEDEIELVNGNRVIVKSYGSQIRGWHPSDIVVDDLESLNNMGTEDSLYKLKDWFYRALMGTMVPETRLSVIGTVIARKSLLSELVIKNEFRGRIWKALAEGDDGVLRSIWPERWPVDWLLSRKKLLGTHRFNAEYQNEPVSSSDPIIFPEWIRKHTDVDMATVIPLRRYMAVDPAFTEERWGNYSAIIVMDEAPDGTLYERLAWRKKVALPELAKTILSFYRHFKSNCAEIHLGIEEVAAQKAVRQTITELDPDVGSRIIPIRPDKDKARRLIDVSRHFESGVVSFKTEGLIDELLAAPHGDMDRVDATVMVLKLYEKQHPLGLDSSSIEIDTLKRLEQHELDLYLERAASGVPNHDVPQEYMKRLREAQQISAAMEDLL